MIPALLLLVCLVGEAAPDPRAVRPDAGPSMQDPHRRLAALAPAEAAQELRRVPVPQQFGAAFAYGEGAGLVEGLPALVHRAGVLPVGLRDAFVDGAAHTWAPPDNVSLPVVVKNIDGAVPEPWREPFHNGVMVSWSIASEADPVLVVPRAEAYAGVRGRPVLDGVRIGLQRVKGGDLPAALALAATYPEAYQAALFEELGWRAGDDNASVCDLAVAVVEAQRCAFVHGAARGRTLRTDWEARSAAEGLGEAVSAGACGCDAAAWRGVAWGLALQWGHRPQRARTLARRMDDAVPGASVAASLPSLLHGPRAAPWVDIGD
jgi:hypothetical protein